MKKLGASQAGVRGRVWTAGLAQRQRNVQLGLIAIIAIIPLDCCGKIVASRPINHGRHCPRRGHLVQFTRNTVSLVSRSPKMIAPSRGIGGHSFI